MTEMRVYSHSKLVCISIKTQKIMLEEYVKEKGFNIYDYYIDDGFSGLNFNRPAFKRMIKDIEAGFVNLVITYKTSFV